MKLKITQVFFLEVDPRWYKDYPFPEDPDLTLEEKIVRFETREIKDGVIGWSNLDRGEVQVEIMPEEE